jgi:hypothetical protein
MNAMGLKRLSYEIFKAFYVPDLTGFSQEGKRWMFFIFYFTEALPILY